MPRSLQGAMMNGLPRIGGRVGSMFCAGVVTLALAAAAAANEVVVQNDSLGIGQPGTIQAGFDAGESAAVWLTSPCNGAIVAVQIAWRSVSGTTGQSLEELIEILGPGTFPVPGPPLDPSQSFEGPVMTDGALNEFRFLDKNNTVPLNIPVTAGQVFVVRFKFGTDPNPANGPSVVTDLSGCQNGKNGIHASGVVWFNACSLGVTGDFVIRAVIDCGAAPGACCLTDGTCIQVPLQSVCESQNGTFQGANSNCGSINCPQPPGACCFDPSGCADLSPGDCMIAGGIFQGTGTACINSNCPAGACCLPSGTCVPNARRTDCATMGGLYQGDGVACTAGLCPVPSGACCLANGSCLFLTQQNCGGIPGSQWKGAGTTCADLNSNGRADACEPACPGITRGDFTGNMAVDGDDLPGFVAQYISPGAPGTPNHCRADMNGNGFLTAADLNSFIQCLLHAVCP